jgi:excisionase family DNA binding protein
MTTFPEMISAADAARMIGLSDETIRNWIRRGQLAGVNVARPGSPRARYLVRRVDLDNYLASRVIVPSAG